MASTKSRLRRPNKKQAKQLSEPLQRTRNLENEIIARHLKAIQDMAREILMEKENVDPFEVSLFEVALFDFVQALPSTKEDFDSCYRIWAGTLHVAWKSEPELSCLEVYGAGQDTSRPCGSLASRNHDVLYKLVPDLLKIAALVAKDHATKLDVSSFEFQNQTTGIALKPPSIEDVFQAFSKARYWTKSLREINVNYCHMNAVGDEFELEGTYPEALEELHVIWPFNHGGIESSTIYKVASRSSALRVLATGGSGGGTEMSLTNTALIHLCGILSRVNTLGPVHKQVRLTHLPDDDFEKVMDALMNGHSFQNRHLAKGRNARYDLLDFYMAMNQYRGIFSDHALPTAVVPLVLEHCQYRARVFDLMRSESKQRQRRELLFHLIRERVDWFC